MHEESVVARWRTEGGPSPSLQDLQAVHACHPDLRRPSPCEESSSSRPAAAVKRRRRWRGVGSVMSFS